MAQKYADMVYNGQWFTPLREAMAAFADKLEETVTGDVKLKLYKGNIINAGVTSPYSLYDEQTLLPSARTKIMTRRILQDSSISLACRSRFSAKKLGK